MYEVLCCHTEVIAISSDNGVVGGDVGGHHTYNRVESEGEESHGEWAALLDAGGEENAEAERVIDEDGVTVIVVEALDGADEVVWGAHEMEEEEDVGARY